MISVTISGMDLFLSTHWLLPSIALIAFIESLAFAGIIVPGVALLFAAATLAGQQEIALIYPLAAAYLGAVAGDVSSFYLGRYAAPTVRQRWPFRRYPHWLEQGENFFEKYGAYSIVLGRFVGPIRPVIPFVAGALQMRSDLFLGFNLLSALAWAPLYILPGYLLGSSSSTLNPQWLPLLYVVIGVVLSLLLFHKAHQWLQPEKRLARQVKYWLYRHKLWPRARPVPLAAGVLLITMSAGLLSSIALQLSGGVATWNQAALHSLSAAFSNQALIVAITLLGDLWFLLPLTSACGLVLYRQGLTRLAHSFLALALGSTIINYLLKELFAVARPESGQWLDSYSFPSGHASAASAIFAMLAVIICHSLPQQLRRAIYLLFALPILGVALSRVALGVHWPLDCLAGLAEGLIAAALLRIAARFYGWQDQQTPRTGITLAAITLSGSALYIALQLKAALLLY